MDRKLLNEMFKNLLHIGNKSNYRNPKMKNYIYGTVNGIHVINLLETVKKIDEVKAELKDLHSKGKKILFVATKLQSRDAYVDLAEATGHYYVSEKWVPGLLTNFKTIKKRIATYLRLLKDSETGAFDVLSKKEAAGKMLELEKLDRAFKGLKEIKRAPDVLFVVDGIYEQQAIKEANSLKMKSFAILNTNGDESLVDNLIPANTNSVKSTEFIASIIKAELVGTKVNAPVSGKIQKMVQKKVSGEKKTPVEKAPIKKEVTEKAPVEKTP
ncbi:MAG: 30S ribosomal protein S2, partial [Candidatus Gracilibacteria bacterium]